jgi:2-methylcitrate dehydratase PrpD
MIQSESNAVRELVETLSRFLKETEYARIPQHVTGRIETILLDLLGVTLAGTKTDEFTRLVRAWNLSEGPATLIGLARASNLETSARINAIAACCLELDEGNKYAKGHPAIHVVFAALAAAQGSPRPVSGHALLRAITLGYEIAARFGAGSTLKKGVHPHGHLGATGAASAVSLVNGLSRSKIAAAIDTTAGLMYIPPWELVTEGQFSRNLWAGQANVAGIQASTLAAAGLTRNSGALHFTLGRHLGRLDPAHVIDGLGSQWLVSESYSKIHPSCSYTHTPIDIIQRIKKHNLFDPSDISQVRIQTHSLVAPLLNQAADSRLSAMFSLPFMAAVAILNKNVMPEHTAPATQAFQEARDFSKRVSVSMAHEYDAQLPSRRGATVEIVLEDGTVLRESQSNPIGDADFHPLGQAQIQDKLTQLIGSEATDRLVACVQLLSADRDTREFFELLNES